MKTYTIVSSTGEALRVVSLSNADDLACNINSGESYVEGRPPSFPAYFHAGEWQTRSATPSLHHVWDSSTKSWVLPETTAETLALSKMTAWAQIKAERERRMAGTFEHNGHVYDVDPVNIAGASVDAREALIAGETEWTQMWVLSNNTVVSHTAVEMIALGRAAKTVVSNIWATSQYLRGLIDAATTVAEVEAISWPA